MIQAGAGSQSSDWSSHNKIRGRKLLRCIKKYQNI